MSPHPPTRKRWLCYITDRTSLPGPEDGKIRLLLEKIEKAAQAGIDWIQIREKDLSARPLCSLTEQALRRVPGSCRILVNDRLDVAIAAGAGGVHFAEQSIPADEAKRFLKEKDPCANFLVGASVHSLESAREAEKSAADYLIFGPVFPTPSKERYGAPQGTARLAEICRSVSVPVLAIGGMNAQNAAECEAAGAAGIAAIRLFQDAEDLNSVIAQLRA